jgi:hypothetical protein
MFSTKLTSSQLSISSNIREQQQASAFSLADDEEIDPFFGFPVKRKKQQQNQSKEIQEEHSIQEENTSLSPKKKQGWISWIFGRKQEDTSSSSSKPKFVVNEKIADHQSDPKRWEKMQRERQELREAVKKINNSNSGSKDGRRESSKEESVSLLMSVCEAENVGV